MKTTVLINEMCVTNVDDRHATVSVEYYLIMESKRNLIEYTLKDL